MSAATELGMTPAPGPTGTAGGEATLTREQAWSRRAELTSNPEFMERLKANGSGSNEARELAEAVRASSAFTLTTGPTVDPAIFGDQAVAAAAAHAAVQREQIVDVVRSVADISEGVADQIRRNDTVTPWEYNAAKQERDRLMADPEFRTAYLAGEIEARTHMTLCNVILSSKIKQG